jgi:hypothetical protein
MFRSADPPGNRLHAWSEQQAALAEFGLVARGLRAPIAKVLEALPGRDELLLRAAVGVPPEVATTERIDVGEHRRQAERHVEHGGGLAAAERRRHGEDPLDGFTARQETKGNDAPSRMFCHLGIRTVA